MTKQTPLLVGRAFNPRHQHPINTIKRRRLVIRGLAKAALWPFKMLWLLTAYPLGLPWVRWMAWAITNIAVLGTGASLAGFVGFQIIASQVPEPTALYRYRPVVSTQVVDQEGKEQFRLAREYRLFVPYEDMPPLLVQAFLAAEDQRFFEHKGVDTFSLFRAAVANVNRSLNSQRALGASTITQQVAKIYVGKERTFDRKFREAILSAKLEERLSKQEILEIYLNEVFFGVNTYGIGAASERYFGRSLKDLAIEEIAFLAALPKGPSNYHPIRNPEAAFARRNWVIDRLVDLGAISQLDADYAKKKALPATLNYGLHGVPKSYFDQEVRRELERRFGENIVYQRGLKATTTVDSDLQILAHMTLQKHLLALDATKGYRGPVANLDLNQDDWVERFTSIDTPTVFPSWHLALVTSTSKSQANIRFKSGEAGQLTLRDMAWARPYNFGRPAGPKPYRVDNVLAAGDVILVEAIYKDGSSPFENIGQPDLRNVGFDPAETNSLLLPVRSPSVQRFELRQLPLLSGAAVVLDSQTGQIKAMSGGFSTRISDFNRATQARRQPGSTIKPFVALSALENGYRPTTKIDDGPITLHLPAGETWEPKNFDGRDWGPMSLTKALVYSRNLPMVRLQQSLGSKTISQTMIDLGLYKDSHNNPSLVLGANETSLLQLASAYSAVANGGKYIQPTALSSVHDQDGMLLFTSSDNQLEDCLVTVFCQIGEANQVVSEQSAAEVKDMLRGVMDYGTGRRTQSSIAKQVYGKTGTTNGAKDTWFIGFDDRYVVGVFIGYDNPQSLGEKATGGQIAGPVFSDLMNLVEGWRDGTASVQNLVLKFRPAEAFEKAQFKKRSDETPVTRENFWVKRSTIRTAEEELIAQRLRARVPNNAVPSRASQPNRSTSPSRLVVRSRIDPSYQEPQPVLRIIPLRQPGAFQQNANLQFYAPPILQPVPHFQQPSLYGSQAYPY